MNCPCGTQNNYLDCCGLYIEQNIVAPTAETLMRSRYSAYALNNIDYIFKTMRGKPRQGFSKSTVKVNNAGVKWLSLTVLNSTENTVEFKACSITPQGEEHIMHENSLFKQKNGRWYYIGTSN